MILAFQIKLPLYPVIGGRGVLAGEFPSARILWAKFFS
jgi:hypothetical protein